MRNSSIQAEPIATQPTSRYLLLFLVICFIYLCTLSDNRFGLISDGAVMFDTAVSLHEFGELGIAPQFDPNSGKIIQSEHYGKYGLGFPLVLQLPLFVVAPLEKALGEGRSNVLFPLTNMMITAVTALIIALCLKDLGFPFRTGALAAFGFAFGSFAWPYISYDFSEPLQALCLTATFWLLIRGARRSPPSRGFLALAGFTLGFAVLTKAALAILVPSYVFFAWATLKLPPKNRLRYLVWFGFPLVIWSGLIAVLNWYRFGSALDLGYGTEAGQFTTPILTGLYGLLLSPNKGLVFYAPIVLLVPWALWKMRKGYRVESLFLVSVFVLQILLNAKWWSWEGGASWGPRLLLPILPMLAVSAAMLLESAKRALVPFAALTFAGVVINLLGVLIFFLVWTDVVGLSGMRIPLDVSGRPPREYVERDGKKWFGADIASYYLPSLSPIRGHAWLLRLRYFDKPFSIRTLCSGGPTTGPRISFPPIEINFAALEGPVISQLCSAHFWLWETVSGRPRKGDSRYPLYGVSLELQGDRATAEGNLVRALDCYQRTADLMPGFARPTLKLSALLLQSGRTVEAEQALVSFLAKHPTDTAARFALARFYEIVGDRAAAVGEYRALLSLRPGEELRRMVEARIAALQEANQ